MTADAETIVITGMGAVSSLGPDVPALWRGLVAGHCGIGPLTKLDAGKHRTKHAGEVKGLQDVDAPDPALYFVLKAASEALAQGCVHAVLKERVALILGSNFGAMNATEALLSAAPAADPRLSLLHGPTECAAEMLGLGGIRESLSLSCASGNAAMCRAADLIRSGQAEMALAGGYDALSEVVWAGLCSLRAMSSKALRPFDKRRDGTVFGEGAGILFMESARHAAAREAVPLATFLGGATTSDAYHMTHPEPNGAGIAEAMRAALDAAGMAPERVDHINAHATGTPYNDKLETVAIKSVFGKRAYAIPINGVKSMIGHALGAASALEAIAAIMTIREGVIPPTIGLEESDSECDLDYIPLKARCAEVHTVLNNSAGFGGCNACVVLGRAQ